MSASMYARRRGVKSLQFTNGTWTRFCELGVFLPAGVLVTPETTYFREEYGNPYDGSLKVSGDVAKACALCARSVLEAIEQGIARERTWITEEDRNIARWNFLQALEVFLLQCGGFHVS